MILLVGWYEDADPRRRSELLRCLQRNAANDRFDQIRVFLEDPSARVPADPVFAHPKVRTVAHGRRLTFRDLFAYANAHCTQRRVVVANADIYFDDTLALLDGLDLAGRFLCLSRWDVQPDGSSRLLDHSYSQDAWIFQTPIREPECDFHLGIPACDNRVAFEAESAGLVVSNPSRSIRAHHLHLSPIHHYTANQRVAGPVRGVPAVFLETPSGARGPAPDVPLAKVAFREPMGYTVERLAGGTSSHNNEARPFAAIPEALDGLPFTQVVAARAAPVEVTFRAAGKLYVLVGDDWDGSRAATDWLRAAGFREPIPLVRTQPGFGFEVWALVGEAGARYVIPTQVVLVAAELTRAPDIDPPAVSREPIFAPTSLAPGAAPRRNSAEPEHGARTGGVPPVNNPAPTAPEPLVSCIMPTYNRRQFVPLAVRNFLAQDYPNRELVVIDDGSDPVADLVEGVPRVRYFRLPGRVTIGEKRNLACELAAGSLIAHWDDDDWYSPRRLSYQTEPIRSGAADITGLATGGVLVLPAGEFWSIRPWLHQRMFVGDVHGGTLVFRKALIDERVRYPAVNLAEDAAFLRAMTGRGSRLCRLANAGTFVYVRHGVNSWRFDAGRHLNSDGWHRADRPEWFSPDVLEGYRIAARTE